MRVWLVGTGPMSTEYYKVLQDLDVEVTVIGRGERSAKAYQKETGVKPFIGGLSSFLKKEVEVADKAIVAVSVEQLFNCCIELIDAGISEILVEKPGGLNFEQVEKLSEYSTLKNVNIYLGYNRRYYASVLKAKEIIDDDGGLTSFNFEFTEWSHKIKDIPKAEGVKEQWLLANSSHVIDLAFYIGGLPKEISCYTAGRGEIDWHPEAARYAGAGITEAGVLFNYQANWNAPGRWRLEFLTRKHRLYFAPIEKLQIQKVGSITIEDVKDLDYSIDEEYKPGLYYQVENFIIGKDSLLSKINNFNIQLSFYKYIKIGKHHF